MICLRCKKNKSKDEFDFDPAVNRLSTYCRLCNWELDRELTRTCNTCGERKHYSKFHESEETSSGCSICCMKCTAKKKKNDRAKRRLAEENEKYRSKCCTVCGCQKLNVEFETNKMIKGGLHSTCNACLKLRGTNHE